VHPKRDIQIVCKNRKARHDYHIEERLEAGLVLAGSEVKSLREGRGNLTDAYAQIENGEAWLVSCQIAEYAPAHHLNQAPRRRRKLLLSRQELSRLAGLVDQKGCTLIPLSIYFSERGFAKVELAVARGKREYDRRQEIVKREANRELARAHRLSRRARNTS
jgi:SsrA-binding protein